jgi:hypothetical protein
MVVKRTRLAINITENLYCGQFCGQNPDFTVKSFPDDLNTYKDERLTADLPIWENRRFVAKSFLG